MSRVNIIWLLLVLMLHVGVCAQKPLSAIRQKKIAKPLLFSNLPGKFECNEFELQKLFSLAVNESFYVQISDQFFLKGKIAEKNQQVPGTFSVNIRAENFDNALFNISFRLQADNSFRLRGSMIHPRYGDVLLLTKEDNRYVIIKRDQRLFMPE